MTNNRGTAVPRAQGATVRMDTLDWESGGSHLRGLGDTVILDAFVANRLIARASELEVERYLDALRRDEGITPASTASSVPRPAAPGDVAPAALGAAVAPPRAYAIAPSCPPFGPPGGLTNLPLAPTQGSPTTRERHGRQNSPVALALLLLLIGTLSAAATFGALRAHAAHVAAERAAAAR